MAKVHDNPSERTCTIHFQPHEWQIIDDWSIRNGLSHRETILALLDRGLRPPKCDATLHTLN